MNLFNLHFAILGILKCAKYFSQSKVADASRSISSDENVVRLKVSMYDTGLVAVLGVKVSQTSGSSQSKF